MTAIYLSHHDIKDVRTDENPPPDDKSTFGVPSRWRALYLPPGKKAPVWCRIYTHRNPPRALRTWIEHDGRRLFIAYATWTWVLLYSK
jgi:hypothetical protein